MINGHYWRYLSPRTFRVEFNTPDTVAEFRDMFAEGKVNLVNIFRKRNPFVDQELAEQSEILETVGDQDPSQFYYGQVTFISTVTPLCKEQLSFMSMFIQDLSILGNWFN